MSDDMNVMFFDKREIGEEKFDALWKTAETVGITPAIYESVISKEWFETLNFCGCGCPEEVQLMVRNTLRAMHERSESGWDKDTVNETILKDNDTLRYFVLYVLEALGLTEHGSSVGGSWLTDKGRKTLELFEKEKSL